MLHIVVLNLKIEYNLTFTGGVEARCLTVFSGARDGEETIEKETSPKLAMFVSALLAGPVENICRTVSGEQSQFA